MAFGSDLLSLSSSLSELLEPELEAAFFAAFFGAGFLSESELDPDPELLLEAAFLAAAFFGAGFSSEESESSLDEDDSAFFF